jgi:hypothetical protein
MVSEESALKLANVVRRVVRYSKWRGDTLSTEARTTLRTALREFDQERKKKTSFQRILEDEDDDLPNSTQPHCKFSGCDKLFRPHRKDQLYCGRACRQAAFKARQRI